MTKKRKKRKHVRPERVSVSGFNANRFGVVRIVSGLAMFVLAVFSLISSVSYLFTWKEDQSLLSNPDMMDLSVDVSNIAGKTGYLWANFLVGKCFGIGAFALVVLLFAVSVKLLGSRWRWGWIRTVLICLSGAFLTAMLCSFFGIILGSDNAFGGGWGGYCGHAMSAWLMNHLGSFISFLVLLLCVVVWLLFTSRRFAEWLVNLGTDENACDEDSERGERRRLIGRLMTDEGSDTDSDNQNGPVSNGGMIAITKFPSDGVKAPVSVDVDSPIPEEIPEPTSVAAAEGGMDCPDSGNFSVETGEGYNVNVHKELKRIDVRDEVPKFKFPSIDLLDDYASDQHVVTKVELESNNSKIRSTLLNYRIQVESVTAVVGPTVTLYKVVPAKGVKISSIKNIDEDIAMSLGADGVRVVNLKDAVGIEVANETRSVVPLKSMFNAPSFRDSKAELPVAIGYTIQQEVKTFDLAGAPHLLVAGATQQGKSVGLNVIIASLLYKKHPSELKFVFIDPKMVEFTSYRKLLKHYLAVLPTAGSEEEEKGNSIVTKPKQADEILKSLCEEMDQRYILLSKACVNKVKDYNEKFKDRYLRPDEGHRYLPYLVVVVDEFADLAMSGGNGPEGKAIARGVSTSIIRLAQKGRAAGIHVIIATQRPSVDVVTPLIKANFPMRIAFRVANRFDSSTILDQPGAEKLIGRGDMLFYAGVSTERVQCAMVSMEEINRVTEFIGSQTGYKQCYNTPYYLPLPPAQEGESSEPGMVDMQHLDNKFEEAARLVVSTQKGSTSDLQRKLGVGYAKAGRIMDQLESAGIVGPQEGSKPRQVLVSDFAELDGIISAFVK